HRRRGQRAREGLPRRGDPARPPRGVAGLGVRAVGDRARPGVGARRRHRRAAAARHVLARLRRDRDRHRARRGAVGARRPRAQPAAVPRAPGTAGRVARLAYGVRVPRRLLAAPVAALLLAGCGAQEPPPPPEVTFTAGAAGTVAAPVRRPVPPGTARQVAVPPELAQTPWQVVFSYTDAEGTPIDERSPVFAPGARSDWTLQLSAPEARLITAEVQQYGPPPQ